MDGINRLAKSIVKDYLRKDRDYHILVFGGEGSGKSNWSFGMGSNVSPTFGVKCVVFNRKQFMDRADRSDKGEVIIGDEGSNIIAKSDTLKPEQIQVIKKITMMRKYNLLLIFNMSDPNMLHNYYVRHRLAERGIAVVRIKNRGTYIWYSRKSGALAIMREKLLKPGKTFSWSDIKGRGVSGSFPDYESKHPKFSEIYRKRNREAITGVTAEGGKSGFNKGDVIRMLLKVQNMDEKLTNYKIAELVGSSSSYVRETKREMDLGKPSKNS